MTLCCSKSAWWYYSTYMDMYAPALQSKALGNSLSKDITRTNTRYAGMLPLYEVNWGEVSKPIGQKQGGAPAGTLCFCTACPDITNQNVPSRGDKQLSQQRPTPSISIQSNEENEQLPYYYYPTNIGFLSLNFGTWRFRKLIQNCSAIVHIIAIHRNVDTA